MRKLLANILFILLFSGSHLTGQVTAGGIVNKYYKVIGMGFRDVTFPDTTDLSDLSPGDKVMLIQLSGADALFMGASSNRNVGAPNNIGQTQFLVVSKVDQATYTVEFSASIKESWDVGEKIQMVKMLEARTDMTVESTLYAKPWDGHTGGIVGLIAYESITLNADIDVSGNGYLGPEPLPYSYSVCDSTDSLYFDYHRANKAGLKGEGILTVDDSLLVGTGNNLNGGGGGHGYLGGGAGGSNYSSGGIGGLQNKNECLLPDLYAWPGNNITNIYELDYRLHFGAAGGGTTEVTGSNSSKGGNGGGLVVIITDTLYANGHTIYADGESVTEVATGGAGGGGAGGTVALAVNGVKGDLNVSVNGGDGGDVVSTDGFCGGSGGGGGAGVTLTTLESVPSNIDQDNSGGSRGSSDCSNGGGPGTSGSPVQNILKVNLNGFIFNSIYGGDTICAGQRPDTIKATYPSGGSGQYKYTWLKSTDSVNWEAITIDPGDTLMFQPGELLESTHFTRAVNDLNDTSINDTAISVYVHVYPVIENNLLAITDTICEKTSPGILAGEDITVGGNGVYTYLWQTSTDLITWNDRATTEDLSEITLTATQYYRRAAQSANVCFDTSNIDTITVLTDISNNAFITTDTTICSGLSGGNLELTQPQGGDGLYRYEWLQGTDNISFSALTGTEQSYDLGILTNAGPDSLTNYYKRIVYSGAGDACADTTTVSRLVAVLPVLSYDDLFSDSARYCYGDVPLTITAGTTSGGNGNYTYLWQQQNLTKATGWENIANSDVSDYNFTSRYFDTTQFRRITFSGRFDACKDTSSILVIRVLDSIVNQIYAEDTALCQGGVPFPFNESEATGGAGNFTYQWIVSEDEGASWENVSGTGTNVSYTSEALNETSLFARVVTTDICNDTSPTHQITIYPSIDGNEIIGGLNQYTCYNTPVTLSTNTITGGQSGSNYVYSWQASSNGSIWNEVGTGADYTSGNLTDTTSFFLIIKSGDYDECIDTSLTTTIQINALPVGNIIAMADTICKGDTLKIKYELESNNHGPWIFRLGNTETVAEYTVTENSTNGELPIPFEQSQVLKLLELEDDSTCFADLSNADEQIDLTVYENPVAEAGENASVCGDTLTLSAVPSVGDGNWSAEGISFDDGSLPNAISTASELDKTYQLTWTETNWTCWDTNSIVVLYSKQPETVDAGGNTTLDYEFEYTLDGSETEYVGAWAFVIGHGTFEDSTYNYSEVYFPDSLGKYYLTWTISNGACTPITDTVVIEVGEDAPDGFSPFNGDDLNDTYVIKFNKNQSGSLTVLNKYGNTVRYIEASPDEEGDMQIEWLGYDDNGNELPNGMYFLIIERDGDEPDKRIIEIRR